MCCPSPSDPDCEKQKQALQVQIAQLKQELEKTQDGSLVQELQDRVASLSQQLSELLADRETERVRPTDREVPPRAEQPELLRRSLEQQYAAKQALERFLLQSVHASRLKEEAERQRKATYTQVAQLAAERGKVMQLERTRVQLTALAREWEQVATAAQAALKRNREDATKWYNTEFTPMLKSFDSEVKRLNQELTREREVNEDLRDDVTALQKTLSATEQQLADLRTQVRQLTTERTQQQEAQTIATERVRTLMENLQTTTDAFTSLSDLAAARDRNARAQIKSMQRTLKRAVTSWRDMKRDKDAAEAELEDMQGQWEAVKMRLQSTIKRAAGLVQEQMQRRQSAESQVTEMQQQVNALQTMLTNVAAERDSLVQRVNEVLVKQAQLEEELGTANANLAASDKEFENALRRNRKLQARVQAKDAELNEVKADLATTLTMMDELTTSVTTGVTTVQQAGEREAKLKERSEQLREREVSLQKELEQLRSEVATATATLQTVTSERDLAQTRVNMLESNMDDVNTQLQVTMTELNEAREEITRVTAARDAELATVRADLATAEKDLDATRLRANASEIEVISLKAANERAERQRALAERMRQQAEIAQARAEQKLEIAETRRAEAEKKQGEAERKQGEAERKQGEAERKQGEAERKQGEAEKKQAEAEKKQGEAEKNETTAKADATLAREQTRTAQLQVMVGRVGSFMLRRRAQQATAELDATIRNANAQLSKLRKELKDQTAATAAEKAEVARLTTEGNALREELQTIRRQLQEVQQAYEPFRLRQLTGQQVEAEIARLQRLQQEWNNAVTQLSARYEWLQQQVGTVEQQQAVLAAQAERVRVAESERRTSDDARREAQRSAREREDTAAAQVRAAELKVIEATRLQSRSAEIIRQAMQDKEKAEEELRIANETMRQRINEEMNKRIDTVKSVREEEAGKLAAALSQAKVDADTAIAQAKAKAATAEALVEAAQAEAKAAQEQAVAARDEAKQAKEAAERASSESKTAAEATVTATLEEARKNAELAEAAVKAAYKAQLLAESDAAKAQSELLTVQVQLGRAREQLAAARSEGEPPLPRGRIGRGYPGVPAPPPPAPVQQPPPPPVFVREELDPQTRALMSQLEATAYPATGAFTNWSKIYTPFVWQALLGTLNPANRKYLINELDRLRIDQNLVIDGVRLDISRDSRFRLVLTKTGDVIMTWNGRPFPKVSINLKNFPTEVEQRQAFVDAVRRLINETQEGAAQEEQAWRAITRPVTGEETEGARRVVFTNLLWDLILDPDMLKLNTPSGRQTARKNWQIMINLGVVRNLEQQLAAAWNVVVRVTIDQVTGAVVVHRVLDNGTLEPLRPLHPGQTRQNFVDAYANLFHLRAAPAEPTPAEPGQPVLPPRTSTKRGAPAPPASVELPLELPAEERLGRGLARSLTDKDDLPPLTAPSSATVGGPQVAAMKDEGGAGLIPPSSPMLRPRAVPLTIEPGERRAVRQRTGPSPLEARMAPFMTPDQLEAQRRKDEEGGAGAGAPLEGGDGGRELTRYERKALTRLLGGAERKHAAKMQWHRAAALLKTGRINRRAFDKHAAELQKYYQQGHKDVVKAMHKLEKV